MHDPSPPVRRENLNSNVGLVAKFTSPETVNSWGIIAEKKEKSFWVANNGSDTLTKYSDKGKLLYNVKVTGQAPTGLVANDSSSKFKGFKLITATENGTIEGFNPTIDSMQTVNAVTTFNAVYKGLVIAKDKLYVCNFRSGEVEVYDSNFKLVFTFTDPALVAAGYAPFNIAFNGERLYVTFAMQDDAKHDDVKGDGFGYIDIFDLDDKILHRFVNREPLNAPWGLLFSQYDQHLYVGNFGDGRINVFDGKGEFLGPLRDRHGNIVVLDGLWGITCGNKGILFASGIDAEANGLIGVLRM